MTDPTPEARREQPWLDRPLTKRQLAYGFIAAGLAAGLAILLVDVLGAGAFQGLGPAQRLALAGAGVAVLVGLTLWPLGDRPA